jgi:hypothetical protein
MIICRKLITCSEGPKDTSEFPERNVFLPSDSNIFHFADHELPEQTLKNLVFHIARKPRQLIAHIQRIYYCYSADLSEQLFAALVDFLVILDRRGAKISRRMIKDPSSLGNNIGCCRRLWLMKWMSPCWQETNILFLQGD